MLTLQEGCPAKNQCNEDMRADKGITKTVGMLLNVMVDRLGKGGIETPAKG